MYNIERVTDLLNNNNKGIMVYNKEGVLVDINGHGKNIINSDSNNIVGKPIKHIVPNCCIMKVLSTGRSYSGLLNYKGSNIFSLAFPILDMDSVVGAVSVLENDRNKESITSRGNNRKYNEDFHNRRYQPKILEYIKDKIIYKSAEMEKVIKIAQKIAKVDSVVLLLGETGVGKGVISKIIHENSDISDRPFVQINCSSIPETLFESELFGYEKGSFTGANKEGKPGLIETAQGGTIFLDEIGDLPLCVQSKLLKVLEEKKIMRVGGIKPIKINVRVIAATNKNLRAMIGSNGFREDLFYRLNVLSLAIPPLRKRRQDIIPLSRHYLEKYCLKYNLSRRFSQNIMEFFVSYHWPGNVRELQNMIERLVIFSDKEEISKDLLTYLLQEDTPNKETEVTENDPNDSSTTIPLGNLFEQVEKQLLERALLVGGTSRKAAKLLNVNQSTVVRKAKKYNLTTSG